MVVRSSGRMDGYFQHFQEKISRRWIPHSALPRIGAAPRTGSSPLFFQGLKNNRQGPSGSVRGIDNTHVFSSLNWTDPDEP